MKIARNTMNSSCVYLLFSVIYLLNLSLTIVEAKTAQHDLQWQRVQNGDIISLRRISGDALGVRQRLEQEGQDSLKIITEISHLTSGCGLELAWDLAQTKHSQHDLQPAQRGLRQLAKKIKENSWPKQEQKTRILGFRLDLPRGAELSQVEWFGCAWAHERLAGEGDGKNKTNKVRPTLPNGAKSTRAIGMKAVLGQGKQSAPELQSEIQGGHLILRSPHWAFALVIKGPRVPIQSEQSWSWERINSVQKGPKKTIAHQQSKNSMRFQLSIVHASVPLTPIKSFTKDFDPEPSLKQWQVISDFLSYQEGVIDGLGKHGQSRSWASLLLMATLSEADLAKLSSSWCEAALLGALKSLPAWPHIFKAYKRPMKTLDGRLILPIALAQYLFKHPDGKKRADAFLKSRFKGMMLSSVIKRHMQEVIGRASFFANRPAQKHLIAVSESEVDQVKNDGLQYSFTESVAIMPKSLMAIEKLLSDDQTKRLLGAPIGLALRAGKIQAVWANKSRTFFRRQLEVYEARRRIENWGRFLEIQDPQVPALSVKAAIKYYTDRLNQDPPTLTSYLAFDMLWGQHDRFELDDILNSARPFPAGLVSEYGMLLENSLPFTNDLKPLNSKQLIPNAGASALWIYGLNRQLKRKWPYKLIIKLEDSRLAIWEGLKKSSQFQKVKQTSEIVSKVRHSSSWQSLNLSFFDSLALFTKAPPPIKAKQNVDSRELR